MSRKFTLGLVLYIVNSPLVSPQSQPASDVWSPVRFLVGKWEGTAKGQPGTGRSAREYRFVLKDRYIEIRNVSTYPPQEKNPKGEVHEDWGMISFDRGRKRLVLRQFHTEGFVNQFVADTATAGGGLRFVSESIENIPPGYRARETYELTGTDGFVERFEIADPGKDFVVYSETRFTRVR